MPEKAFAGREAKADLKVVMHAGGPSPGMNTAVRAAVRLGLDKGHEMLACANGFRGLVAGEIEDFLQGEDPDEDVVLLSIKRAAEA